MVCVPGGLRAVRVRVGPGRGRGSGSGSGGGQRRERRVRAVRGAGAAGGGDAAARARAASLRRVALAPPPASSLNPLCNGFYHWHNTFEINFELLLKNHKSFLRTLKLKECV